MATKKNAQSTKVQKENKAMKAAAKKTNKNAMAKASTKAVKITADNYSANIAQIKKGGVNEATVKKLNQFVADHYEKCFGYAPTKEWCISMNGKLYFAKKSYVKYVNKTKEEEAPKTKVSTKSKVSTKTTKTKVTSEEERIAAIVRKVMAEYNK